MENKKIISDLSFTSLIPIIVTNSSLTLTLIPNSTFLTNTQTRPYFHISTKSIRLDSSLFLSTLRLGLFFSHPPSLLSLCVVPFTSHKDYQTLPLYTFCVFYLLLGLRSSGSV